LYKVQTGLYTGLIYLFKQNVEHRTVGDPFRALVTNRWSRSQPDKL